MDNAPNKPRRGSEQLDPAVQRLLEKRQQSTPKNRPAEPRSFAEPDEPRRTDRGTI